MVTDTSMPLSVVPPSMLRPAPRLAHKSIFSRRAPPRALPYYPKGKGCVIIGAPSFFVFEWGLSFADSNQKIWF